MINNLDNHPFQEPKKNIEKQSQSSKRPNYSDRAVAKAVNINKDNVKILHEDVNMKTV